MPKCNPILDCIAEAVLFQFSRKPQFITTGANVKSLENIAVIWDGSL